MLRRLGWHYLRVHSFELFGNPEAVATRVATVLGKARRPSPADAAGRDDRCTDEPPRQRRASAPAREARRRARLTPAPGSDPAPETGDAAARDEPPTPQPKRGAAASDDERITRERPPHW